VTAHRGAPPVAPREPEEALVAELRGADAALTSIEGAEAQARAALDWAANRFGEDLVVATSFQDWVLADLARRASKRLELVFVDTGGHFPETLAYLEAAVDMLDLRLRTVSPTPAAVAAWPCGTDGCCAARKVAPLQELLDRRAAWATGLRRVEAPTRAGARLVAWDASRHLVKVNPLAAWTDQDVAAYEGQRGLPPHPLRGAGYRSIGCAATTAPVRPGEDARSGRWAGSIKTECGLHL
jgi:phosphoadenosine phosphosulfate reductase